MAYLDEFLTIFLGFIAIMHPLPALPAWLELTADYTPQEKAAVRARILKNVTVLLLLFLFLGKVILVAFGLTVPAIRIAGALVFIVTALNTLTGKGRRLSPTALSQAAEREDISFSPMTMPLMVGPGAMALMLQFADDYGYPWDTLRSLIATGYMLASIVVILALAYLTFRYSDLVYRRLGNGGVVGLSRIMAFILLAIGVQYLLTAIRSYVGSF